MARLEQFDKYISLTLEDDDQTLEIGRQRETDPKPLDVIPVNGGRRIVIASLKDVSIGRMQLRLTRGPDDSIHLANIHSQIPVGVELEPDLAPGKSAQLRLPTTLRIGNLVLKIETPCEFSSLVNQPSIGFAQHENHDAGQHSLLASVKLGNNRSLLFRMEQLIRVLQESVTSPDFMKRIARTSVELFELDHAAVLLWDGREWKQEACAAANVFVPDAEWVPSMSLLTELLHRRRTTYFSPKGPAFGNEAHSLKKVTAVVAAPILDANANVIGAVYGDRSSQTKLHSQAIDELDAQLVEVLACGVAAGLMRLDQERELLARRLQFEQFVTKEVADMILAEPESLSGQDKNVTLLFCDIAGFSRISEKLSPQQTFDWINDVMGALTECVRRYGGTIVDYIGDELIAMWGAPFQVDEPAVSACRAAVDMIQSLNELNIRWQHILGEATRVGIGINSGVVRVGNTGSQHKLKYGPLGSEVNLASRIQGATRYLRTSVLLTQATAKYVSTGFSLRRLCTVKVKNIDAPLDLYELPTAYSESWGDLCQTYAEALKLWEDHELQAAINQLSQIVAKHPDDAPSLVLLSRAIEVWSRSAEDYDSVWTLPSK